MTGTHLDVELIAHLRDELAPVERARVDDHLAACAECRQTEAVFQALLTDLRAVEPPVISWGRWQAELRGRLAVAQSSRPWWRRHPAGVALAMAAAAAVIALVVPLGRGLFEPAAPHELAAFEEVTIGSRLDLLQQYQVVENLDLLEDLDVISHLDHLEHGRES